jgi:5-methylcytosine-specific restriction endonuclease McrA
MGKTTQIPTNVRRDVRLRDMGRCRRCGMAGTEQHHRIRRRDGGHRRSNIVLLCHDCHRDVTENPLTAKLTGYIVPPWIEDGTLVTPLQDSNGRWVLLDDEGGVTYTKEIDL